VSDYFDLSPGGEMTIVKGGRTVLTTAGRLVPGLPSGYDYVATATLTFPDFSKDWLYSWRWRSQYVRGSSGQQYKLDEAGYSFVSVPPQETSSSTTLQAAPSSFVNLFMPLIRINRTTAPSHTWFGNTIAVKPPSNVWIPYTGSVLLEEQPGMARAFTLRISGGNLVMEQQQSVSGGPGFNAAAGYNGTSTTMPYGQINTGTTSSGGDDAAGGEWAYGSAVGLAVYSNASVTPMQIAVDYTPFAQDPTLPMNARRTTGNAYVGAAPASITDPTNYHSIYSIEIAGKYSRAT
jgi:hypothetical protein